jgi:NAD(P)-dependent dehydrogenase (short-subunit alcohol dehydrogenase family)
VNFAAITLRVASQRVFSVVSLYYVIDSVRKLLDTPSYIGITEADSFFSGVCYYPKAYTKDGFEMHIGVNHLGHFLLTCLLMPRIIRSAPARIVTVSSYKNCLGQ